jgi:hypothetical protein
MHTSTQVAVVAIMTATVSLLVGVPQARACSCVPPPTPCDALQSGAVIFVGTPTAATPGRSTVAGQLIRFHFSVDDRIAGDVAGAVDVETPPDGAACGVEFRVGAKYLVYAEKTPDGLVTSFCTRTAPLAFRQDDLTLFKETSAGRVQPRLTGMVARFELRLDGFYMHGDLTGGVPGIPITVRDSHQAYEATSDERGWFTLLGLKPGKYELDARLPARYEPLFDHQGSVNMNGCLAEAEVVVAAVPLKGTVRNADGSAASDNVILRVAQLDAANGISFARTTLAFSKGGGAWKIPGLPPGRYLLGVNTFDAPSATSPYSTTWYPNVQRASDAAVIEVSDDRPQTIDFVLPGPLAPVNIAGRVVDASGKAVRDASVDLYDDDDPHAVESWKSSVGSTTTDDGGQFSVRGFKGRRYHVQARVFRPGGGSSLMVPVTLETPDSIVSVTIPTP